MTHGRHRLYNLVTLFFAGLSVLVGAGVAAILGGAVEPPIFAPAATELPPTVRALDAAPLGVASSPTAVPPTERPTATPTITPTATPAATATATLTRTPAPSATPLASPSRTRPPASHTPTMTPTFTPSFTPSATPTPAGPTPTLTATPSPFPFVAQPGTPRLRDNFANTSGCNWQGVAGQVISDLNEPLLGLQIRVSSDATGERTAVSGTNTLYGDAGWEIVLGSEPTTDRFRVSLWSPEGEQLSPIIEIGYGGTCLQNLALVNFVQTRPF